MRYPSLPPWKKAPFIRYIVPFSGGVLLQWEYDPPIYLATSGAICCILITYLLNIRSITARFKFYYAFGICIFFLQLFIGSIFTYYHDIRNSSKWIGHVKDKTTTLLVSVEEPVQEKARSYKVLVSVEKIIRNDSIEAACGRIILYLKKDISISQIRQGSLLLIGTSLNPVGHFENAAGFNYSRYCALQNIYHQVFLKTGQYIILPGNNSTTSAKLLLYLKERTISILRKYIDGKKESGLAEALLIGYKDDLDKELVRSYSNTGVVHIIAISGLHVGLIYAILLFLLKPLRQLPFMKWTEPVILISFLWIFSLLAGGSASVLRSAVMFSGIIIGKSIDRGNSVYNSLAASAFLLLCYDPMWLYDAGFQLSYLAVLSLSLFMKPFYNVVYVRNRILNMIWKLAAITLAAQVLTIPICLYYFNQFPNMFLVTNMIAVPLSSIIVIAEIFLCAVSFYDPLASITGRFISSLIRVMNDVIMHMESMPLAVTKDVGISIYQVIVLYLIIFVFTKWLGKYSFPKEKIPSFK